MAEEYSDELSLPNFRDRLPDLILSLKQSGKSLQSASPRQSYLPYWEDVYMVAHTLKGLVRLLSCSPQMSSFILNLNELLQSALGGPLICRNLIECGKNFIELSDLLESEEDKLDFPALEKILGQIKALLTEDIAHEQRMESVPAHLFYVNDFVSKKAREVSLLQLHQCAIEDKILLEEIPFWRGQINEALLSPEFGRGLVVNFLPFLSPEGSSKLNVWCWVAAASHSRASLKQRLKEVLPSITIGKI